MSCANSGLRDYGTTQRGGTRPTGSASSLRSGLNRRFVEPLQQRRRHLQFRHRLGDRQRLVIRPRGGHGVKGVRDADNPRHQRDLVAGQSARVAGPVQPLVMMADGVDGQVDQRGLGEHLGSDVRVTAHRLPLLLIQGQ